MTKEEAIEILNQYRKRLTDSVSNQLDKDIEASEMAIEALKENEKLKQGLEKVKQELATFKALC